MVSNTVKRIDTTENGDKVHVFDCQKCGKEFTRVIMRGVRPLHCVACRQENADAKQAERIATLTATLNEKGMAYAPTLWEEHGESMVRDIAKQADMYGAHKLDPRARAILDAARALDKVRGA